MPTVQDARGEEIHLDRPPRRIVSLVPSTTETLFALGLAHAVVGVTRFCVHPAAALDGLVKVGGTKDLDMDRLAALKPDLVIGNVEENTPAMFAAVEEKWPLYAALPRTVHDALEDLTTMGELLGVAGGAWAWRGRVESRRALLRQRVRSSFHYTYLIWRQPWMAVSGDTFISSMLAEAGGVNTLAGHAERYPTLTPADMAAHPEDRVLLSSEPFPFKDKHRDELAGLGVPAANLHLVDGELCSWHGVRMAEGFEYLMELLPLLER